MGKDTKDSKGTAAIERLLEEQAARGRRTFFDQLNPELLDDLVVVRARWIAGRYKASKSAVARTVKLTCVERHGAAPSLDTVKRWLDRGAHEAAQAAKHADAVSHS